MEDSSVTKGVFFYTKKLDSELMVRCLQAMLNTLPNIAFTGINWDAKFLGYRVKFSPPDEEEVLKTQRLMVSGESIRICRLKTCFKIQIDNLESENVSQNEIKDAIRNRFGEILSCSPLESSTCHKENVQFWRVLSDIPEINSREMFQQPESTAILLPLWNKKSKLKVTLCCTLCKKDGHITRDCNEGNVAVGKKTPNDHESVFADSTVKMGISFEPKECYAEKIGREEIMKSEYFASVQKEVQKEPETHSRAGLPAETMNADEKPNPCRPESPGPSVKKPRSKEPLTAVEDMSVLSQNLRECIDNACTNSNILTMEKLQFFFSHVKKKSNVVEVALKYVDKSEVNDLKKLLQDISKSFYSSTHTGSKEDKRFIKWLDERIEKFDEKVPPKEKISPSKSK